MLSDCAAFLRPAGNILGVDAVESAADVDLSSPALGDVDDEEAPGDSECYHYQ